jgi:hypothetical protein
MVGSGVSAKRAFADTQRAFVPGAGILTAYAVMAEFFLAATGGLGRDGGARGRGFDTEFSYRTQDQPAVRDERHQEAQDAAHDDGRNLAVLDVHPNEHEALDRQNGGGHHRE